jgi:uncharacterized NAD(P)/FAD-binding protein YdhS
VGELSTEHRNIAIVGGGFSGTALALQLLRRSKDVTVAVIDPADRRARGLAYGTRYDCHLLNVCSADMSAFSNEAGHFWAWAQKNWEHWNQQRANSAEGGVLTTQPIHERSFFPRSFFGEYLTSLLNDMPAEQKSRLQWIHAEAIGIRREDSRYTISFNNGAAILADAVVLATGNFLPGHFGISALANSSRYVHNAWLQSTLADLSDSDEILLVGSGLTSVDMAIALHSKKFRGTIHLLSRHGLLPHCHQRREPLPRFWDERSPRTIRGLLRLFREQAEGAEASGSSWHAAMDSLRPLVQEIWQSLPLKEQRRFLRHARAYWEIHRHRIAPEISSIFRGMISAGQVKVHAGRLTNYVEDQSSGEITFRERHSGKEETLRVTRVINCSGPELNLRKVNSALLQDFFQQGLIRQDTLTLGLDVDRNGALLDPNGVASQQIFALGPARKGSLWETTAVPDLRGQASELADHLLRSVALQEGPAAPHEILIAKSC